MSVRRNVRLRREYLYRKGLEGKERALYEHKQQLKEAIRSAFVHHVETHRIPGRRLTVAMCVSV